MNPLPQWYLEIQSPTTPGQFDMWKNVDIPMSDVPPPSMEPEWYRALLHQVEFDMWKNADIPRSDVPPTNQT